MKELRGLSSLSSLSDFKLTAQLPFPTPTPQATTTKSIHTLCHSCGNASVQLYIAYGIKLPKCGLYG